jgi:hypothetical protein
MQKHKYRTKLIPKKKSIYNKTSYDKAKHQSDYLEKLNLRRQKRLQQNPELYKLKRSKDNSKAYSKARLKTRIIHKMPFFKNIRQINFAKNKNKNNLILFNSKNIIYNNAIVEISNNFSIKSKYVKESLTRQRLYNNYLRDNKKLKSFMVYLFFK